MKWTEVVTSQILLVMHLNRLSITIRQKGEVGVVMGWKVEVDIVMKVSRNQERKENQGKENRVQEKDGQVMEKPQNR